MKSWLLTFTSKDQFVTALKALSHQSQWQVSTITSFDFEEGDKILHRPSRSFAFSRVALIAAVIGILTAFGMEWYSAVIETPLNVGGRPLNSWPAFIPVTFILLVLFSALGSFIFFFKKLHLPWPSHPVFFTKSFDLSKNQFQILLQQMSPQDEFDPQSLHPNQIEEVV